jgi:hypothetical protein
MGVELPRETRAIELSQLADVQRLDARFLTRRAACRRHADYDRLLRAAPPYTTIGRYRMVKEWTPAGTTIPRMARSKSSPETIKRMLRSHGFPKLDQLYVGSAVDRLLSALDRAMW